MAENLCEGQAWHPHNDHIPREGYGRTWAKAILIGEHSVVYGYPAIAIPLHDMTMQAWVSPNNSGEPSRLRALDYDGPLQSSGERFAGLRKAVAATLSFVGHERQGFRITTQSDFPPGRGLGSSAASSGAVIRALLDAYGVQASNSEILELTNEAEQVTHGHPSGLDGLTTSHKSPVRYANGNTEPLKIAGSAYLVIADSGVAGSTRKAVEEVEQRYEHDHGRTLRILAELGDLSSLTADDLSQGSFVKLGRRMDHAQSLLSALGVSHPNIDHLVLAARSYGALGAKLTGGGLGGCLLALAENLSAAQQIRDIELRQGAQHVWIHPLGRAVGE